MPEQSLCIVLTILVIALMVVGANSGVCLSAVQPCGQAIISGQDCTGCAPERRGGKQGGAWMNPRTIKACAGLNRFQLVIRG